jgi:YVTN family beta-propeller protein
LPGSYPSSSRIGVSPDGETLYVALPDHDEVRAIDAETGDVLSAVPVEGTPHRLTVLSDGRVAVSARALGEVAIVDEAASEVTARIAVGAEPFSLIEAGEHIVVAVAGQAELARIPLADATFVEDRVALLKDQPRGLALGAGGELYVSHFKGRALSEVDLDRGVPVDEIDLHLASNPFFVPNQLDSLTVAPTGDEIIVPHEECNNDPAQFGAGGTDLTGAAVQQYYVQGPTGFPAVVPAVTRVDAISKVTLSDGPGQLEPGQTHIPEEPGLVNPLISPLDAELLGANRVNRPVAVAMGDGGAFELVVNYGSGNVLVRRTSLIAGQRSLVAVMPVGGGASSIALSPDGETAYVWNELEHEVRAFNVPARHEVEQVSSIRTLEPKMVSRVASDVLPLDIVEGRKLFNGIDERMTRSGAISCASCHPDGADDGITWNFAEGPRQTPPLWGGIMDTAPFHWDQAVDNVERLNEITIMGRMGGAGLQPQDLRKIGAFIDNLPAPQVPLGVNEASVTRGAEIFLSDATGCTQCHYGAHMTDNLAHNVGTGAGVTPRESITAIATPVMHGLAYSGPYLHDGSAQDLRAVIDRLVVTDQMGTGSQLSEQDIEDLVAFLETL